MVAKAKIKRFEIEEVSGDLPFELGDETFHAKPKLGGITLINFVRGVQEANEASDNEESKGTAVLDLLLGLLKSALGPKEYGRFLEYTEKDGVYVSMETIMEIAQYLVSEYTESPTEAS